MVGGSDGVEAEHLGAGSEQAPRAAAVQRSAARADRAGSGGSTMGEWHRAHGARAIPGAAGGTVLPARRARDAGAGEAGPS